MEKELDAIIKEKRMLLDKVSDIDFLAKVNKVG